ncbi:MAG: glycosyltransferase family 4 protein [Chloroflexi bacterium]|nr:glycosyltransferase family 4 protein [Chloroflexota bacterium]
MHIAQVAPPFETVPPARYGGTERVVFTLTEELVRRGHDVTLFAAGDSQTSARLVPTVDTALWHRRPLVEDFSPYWAVTLGKLLTELSEFDVVHSHLDFFGFPLARQASQPVVTTLHGRLDLPELAELWEEFNDVPLVSISDAQRRPAPNANWVDTIYHGIDLDEYAPSFETGRYLAFLGRISPEKGVDTAIRVARAAAMPIRIAARAPLPYRASPGVVRDWEYYENEVQPLLQGSDVELIGQVGGVQKSDFLRNAAALLFPIRWPEPFGLVMAEALACGTPVIAFGHGSVPEVIEHGVTGFVCESEPELVEAVSRLGEIDRRRCRAEAERRFSPGAMADRYESVYRQLLMPEPAEVDLLALSAGAPVVRKAVDRVAASR